MTKLEFMRTKEVGKSVEFRVFYSPRSKNTQNLGMGREWDTFFVTTLTRES